MVMRPGGNVFEQVSKIYDVKVFPWSVPGHHDMTGDVETNGLAQNAQNDIVRQSAIK